MKFKITKSAWDASGQNFGNVTGTLDWILGYLDPHNANVKLILDLAESQQPSITIELQDQIVKEISVRFDTIDDKLISALLVIAYALGGQE